MGQAVNRSCFASSWCWRRVATAWPNAMLEGRSESEKEIAREVVVKVGGMKSTGTGLSSWQAGALLSVLALR